MTMTILTTKGVPILVDDEDYEALAGYNWYLAAGYAERYVAGSGKPGKRARKHRKSACEACGYTKRLTVHHCDQDQTNNDPSNLQTLCSHCHDFWHATAKRLGKTVAGKMPCLEP